MIPPKEIIDLITEKEKFLILTHSTPDGDAFGSSLALKYLLEMLGKKVEVFTELPVPNQYRFLPGTDTLGDLKNLETKPYDVLFLVDCNSPKRVSNEREITEKIEKFNGTIIIIDHHIETSTSSQENSKLIKWIVPSKAATGILIYELIKALEQPITLEMAKNLYTSIIVDTGNFQFDNTTDEVFQIATELVKAGAKPSYIYQESFESWSEGRFRLFSRMLNKLEITPPLAISFISLEDFQETGTTEPDTERFVEFIRILKNVTISALFREVKKGFIKASLRSKGDIDVSLLARDFGGGGHKNAAGYRITGDFEKARLSLLEKLKEHQLL